MFGTALGLSQRKLHDIEKEGPRIDLSSFMKEGLEVWLSMVDIEHTWWHVSEAVEDSDNNALASRLREKHRDHLKGDIAMLSSFLFLKFGNLRMICITQDCTVYNNESCKVCTAQLKVINLCFQMTSLKIQTLSYWVKCYQSWTR